MINFFRIYFEILVGLNIGTLITAGTWKLADWVKDKFGFWAGLEVWLVLLAALLTFLSTGLK